MTPFWQAITFASVWSVGFVSIPVYFATRALYTGRIYDGGETSRDEWISRAEQPVLFWRKVLFYYALSLIGLAPWVCIWLVGMKE